MYNNKISTEESLFDDINDIQKESRFSNPIISIVPSFTEKKYYIIYK